MRTKLPYKKITLYAVPIIVAIVGTYLTVATFAAGRAVNFEAESAAMSGGVSAISDTSASGGSAIEFANMPSSPVVNSITWQTKQRSLWPTAESIATMAHGKLYVFGGIGETTHYTPAEHAMRYDPVANTWERIADMPNGLTHSAAAVTGDTIWLVAGYPEGTPYGQIFATRVVWKYSISANTYTRGPDLPKLCGTGGGSELDGKVYFVCGTNNNRVDTPEHYVLDPANESAGWTQLANVLNARNHVAYIGYNHKMYLVGGQHNQDEQAIYQNQTDVYDPATNTWTQLDSMVNGRSHVTAATFVASGNIFVLGGEPTTNQSQVYNIANNEWKNTTSIPTARRTPAGGDLGNGKIILAGGDGGSGTHDEAWVGTLNF